MQFIIKGLLIDNRQARFGIFILKLFDLKKKTIKRMIY